MEQIQKTSTKITSNHLDGVPVVESAYPEIATVNPIKGYLMIDNNTRWEDLEMELQRIESGTCMLCNRRTENIICERCVPREL